MQTDFDRERQWWDAKAHREENDRADEGINRALRWRVATPLWEAWNRCAVLP